MLHRKTIRREMKKQLASMTAEMRETFSTAIFREIERLPAFAMAKTILFFWSLPDEVDTSDFANKWHNEKCLLLPVINGDELEIRHYDGPERLKAGPFNLLEPDGELFTKWDKIDMILVPGLAFDRTGNRLGRGKGYYDRLLPRLQGVKIGVCFPFQLIAHIPVEHWDVKVDRVVTMSHLSTDSTDF